MMNDELKTKKKTKKKKKESRYSKHHVILATPLSLFQT